MPTETGLSLFGVLSQADPALVDPEVTAQLECLLDDVVVGRQEMVGAIDAVCEVAARIIGKLKESAAAASAPSLLGAASVNGARGRLPTPAMNALPKSNHASAFAGRPASPAYQRHRNPSWSRSARHDARSLVPLAQVHQPGFGKIRGESLRCGFPTATRRLPCGLAPAMARGDGMPRPGSTFSIRRARMVVAPGPLGHAVSVRDAFGSGS